MGEKTKERTNGHSTSQAIHTSIALGTDFGARNLAERFRSSGIIEIKALASLGSAETKLRTPDVEVFVLSRLSPGSHLCVQPVLSAGLGRTAPTPRQAA